jgi:type I restriction enzyme R subunit
MQFNEPQRVFVDFVLSQYVTVGVEELDHAKITPLFI